MKPGSVRQLDWSARDSGQLMADPRTLAGSPNEGEQFPLYEADLQLIERAQQGKAADVDELLRRLRLIPRILRAQNARLGAPVREQSLDDLAQDVFLIIWRKLESYDGQRPFEAWAYRICRYELMNCIRRQGRHAMAEVHPDVPEPEPSSSPSYEDVHRGIETLPNAEAAVVRLKHFEGMTFDEVGRRMNISSNTAKTRYYRGMSQLEAFLRERRSQHDGGKDVSKPSPKELEA